MVPVGINSHTISGILFDKPQFKNWLEHYKRKNALFSIPQLAKLLGLQQEFTYQLIDNHIIETTLNPNNSSRWVSQKNIDDFNDKYIVLSKLAKTSKVHSRTLMKRFSDNGIYPVDHEWVIRLRQKVYEKSIIFENLYKEPLNKSG